MKDTDEDKSKAQLLEENRRLRAQAAAARETGADGMILGYQDLFDLITDGICVIDHDNNVYYANRVLVEEFGPFQGCKCYKYFHRRHSTCPWCRNDEVFDGQTVRWEWRDEGSGKTYSVVDTPFDLPGGVKAKLEILHDVTNYTEARDRLQSSQQNLEGRLRTHAFELAAVNQQLQQEVKERKAVEAELRAATDRFLAIMENFPEYIYVVDPQTNRILFVNRKLAEAFGEDPVGKLCHEVFQGRDSPCEFCTTPTLQETGEPCTWEYHNEVLDLDFLVTDQLIKWPDGRDVRFELAVDITDRKRTEEMLDQTRQRLLEAQKLEAIGRLAGGVAHDFNNMMHVVIGYAVRGLREIKDRSPLSSYLSNIKSAGEHCAELTRQLLAFSRKQVMKPVPLNLNESVREVEELLSGSLGDHVDLVTVLQPDLGRIMADPAQIQQVLMNLTINARDAMPKGGTLTITTRNESVAEGDTSLHPEMPAGEYVHLAVSDTGKGMDTETQAHIFEPFFSTKGLVDGSGLGLATVYGIVRQSNGYIWVYSETDRGSTFRIYMPRIGESENAAPEGASSGNDSAPCGSETILVVEDHDAVRRLAAAELRDLGYEVLEASNAAEAIETVRSLKGPLHLVLVDVMLPDKSGRETYMSINLSRPGVKALFMSGHPGEHVSKEGLVSSGIQLIEKPFTSETLARRVRETLDQDTSA